MLGWVIDRQTLLKHSEEHRFVPIFRRQCLFGQFLDGRRHDPSNTWIKIRRINRINPPRRINEFTRWNGKPLLRVQGGIIYIRDIV